MAWGSWHWTSSTMRENTGFKVIVYWAWRQNQETRETQLLASQSAYVAMHGANFGYPDPGTIVAGVGFSEVDRVEKTFYGIQIASPNYYQEASYTFSFNDVIHTIKHKPNGSLENSARVYAKADVTTFVGQALEFDWIYKDVSSQIPSLGQLVDKPSGGVLNIIDLKHNSATLDYGLFNIPGGLDHYDVSISDVGLIWVNNGKSNTYTKSGLLPEHRYTASVRAVDKYGQMSPTISMEFMTEPDQARVWYGDGGQKEHDKVWHGESGPGIVKNIYLKENGKIIKSKT